MVNARIKLRSACKIYEFVIYIENLLHVSAAFRGHFQICVVRRICYKEHTTRVNTKSKVLNKLCVLVFCLS
jgi:hypothetical protein